MDIPCPTKLIKHDKTVIIQNLNAYIIFQREIRPIIKENYPDLTFTKINQKISEMWSKLDKKEIENYHKKYKKHSLLQKINSIINHGDVYPEEEQLKIIDKINLDEIYWRNYLFHRDLHNFRRLIDVVNNKKHSINTYKKYIEFKLKNTSIPNDVIKYCIFNYI